MNKRRRYIVLGISITAVLVVLSIWEYQASDYGREFRREKGSLIDINIRPHRGGVLRERSWLTLRSDAGFSVECEMLVPREPGRRYPTIILLGGKAAGRYAIDYVPEVRGAIVVAVDYPYEPRGSYTVLQFIGDVPAIHRALMVMVPSVMLLTDYLVHRPDVDSAKIVVLGYSFGAPFVPCILANDKRPAAAAMVFGGGELYSLVEHNVRRYESAAVSKFVGLVGGFLLQPLEPLRYAERIAPVPLIMINGTEDEMIPRENVEMVYERAKLPKKLIWLRSGHVRPDKVELTKQIVDVLEQELCRLNILEKK